MNNSRLFLTSLAGLWILIGIVRIHNNLGSVSGIQLLFLLCPRYVTKIQETDFQNSLFILTESGERKKLFT